MSIETKTTIKYEYECTECSHYYIEQRNPEEAQFVNKCPACGGGFDLINTTESTYEVEIIGGATRIPII
jgi:predicted SprT family Zn-dependent metalloprotease